MNKKIKIYNLKYFFITICLLIFIFFIFQKQSSVVAVFSTPTSIPFPEKTPMVFDHSEINNDNYKYNGYWEGNYWIKGVPSYETLMLRMPMVAGGSAVTYDPYLMEVTANKAGFDIEKYVGTVAVSFWSEVGHEVWIYHPNYGWEGPFLVVDVSRQIDVYRQIVYQNQVVELDFETAKRWEMWEVVNGNNILVNGRVDGVIVSKVPPEKVNRYPVVQLSDFFLENVKYITSYEKTPVYNPPKNTGLPLPIWKIGDYWVIFPTEKY